jgi:hypothetical protein
MLKRNRRGKVAYNLLSRCMLSIHVRATMRKRVWATKPKPVACGRVFDPSTPCVFLDRPRGWNWTTLEEAKRQSGPLPEVTDERLGDIL